MLGRASSVERDRARLGERRRNRRRSVLVTLTALLFIVAGALVWGLRQSAVRISHIEIFEADPTLVDYATNAMQGNYFGIIPRDSIFFFSEERIRAGILAGHDDMAAVSIIRNGFTSISIKIDYRVPIASWCGSTSSPQVLSPDGDCYIFDTSGFIYATTGTMQTVNPFVLYEDLTDNSEPVGSTLPNAEKLPVAFDFARQLATFGSSVISIAIRGDEVDHILASGTRIIYVLGREQDAFTALVSARDNFNLADGSVDYVDLRFDGKVYVKRVDSKQKTVNSQ
ncbi:MAG TPA: hypothetical protein VJI70_02070 [Candidatus Paceibacterota bacterium]